MLGINMILHTRGFLTLVPRVKIKDNDVSVMM